MLPSQHRLNKTQQFQYVRRKGKSTPTPLFRISYTTNNLQLLRFGFIATKKIGSAVERNRAIRLLREAARSLVSAESEGYDIVLIAQSKLTQASVSEVKQSLNSVLQEEGILENNI